MSGRRFQGTSHSELPETSTLRRYLVRHTLRRLVTLALLLVAFPWLFVHHELAQESRADNLLIVPRPLPPLTEDEEQASQAVLDYRACPSGPSLAQLIDGAMFGGPVGVIHFRSGSRVRQAGGAEARYLVDVVTETHNRGFYGRPSQTEHPIGFSYDATTGQVTGRDDGGKRYLESARWECVREQSPWRRGPPEPVGAVSEAG
jgi:hypothetical protein